MSRAVPSARARARANIALVKYWGKRDARLNLPAAGSLSLTLAELVTDTAVTFDAGLETDDVRLGGAPAPPDTRARVSRFLDLVRARADLAAPARVDTENHFPTASGLASSASGFAALAAAATRAAGLEIDDRALSALARRGSGSAARSIFGGFARMRPGMSPGGEDAAAEPVTGAGDWPVRMVIAIVGGGAPKPLTSRDAMDHCAATSPLYRGWLASVPGDLAAAEAAIASRDLEALGEVTERSALAMHAAAMASRPGVVYFAPATIACLHEVRALRARGTPAYATADAGPHVKALTDRDHASAVARALAEVPGVTEVATSAPGAGVELEGDEGAGAGA